MAEVRAALSEDRRYGTPEEEIEALWTEVDRLTKERQLGEAVSAPAIAPHEAPATESAATATPTLAGAANPASEAPFLADPSESREPAVDLIESTVSVADPPNGLVDQPLEARRRARSARGARP